VTADDERTGTAKPAAAGRRRTQGLLLVLTLLLLGAGSWWWFSAGPGAYVGVPDVTGLTADDAEARLATAGLRADLAEAHDDAVPAGLVVSTDPAPGERVRKDGEVTVVVSLGVLMLEVPETAGSGEADALAVLDAAGFTIGDIDRPYHMEVPEGTVIGTTPAAGEVVRHDQRVTVTISNGREPVTIPSVVGATRSTAEKELAARGLVPEASTEYSDDVPKDSVISQDPAAGPALRGDTVSIVVSLGPPLVAVPQVVGKQVGEAQQLLQDAGLEVRVQRVLGGYFGTVRAADPAAGQQVPRGSTVTLTVV
jgi:beta-lactam-binding protein with PASTA domain